MLDYYLQLKLFSQLFTWPTDQPRYATYTSGYPVDTNFAPKWEVVTVKDVTLYSIGRLIVPPVAVKYSEIEKLPVV